MTTSADPGGCPFSPSGHPALSGGVAATMLAWSSAAASPDAPAGAHRCELELLGQHADSVGVWVAVSVAVSSLCRWL